MANLCIQLSAVGAYYLICTNQIFTDGLISAQKLYSRVTAKATIKSRLLIQAISKQ